MNYLMLPLVHRISGPEEFPFSRAKIQVGEDWFIVVDQHGPILMPVPVRHNSSDNPMMGWQSVGYHCVRCTTTFLAYDHNGYIHKCCEVE